MTSNNWWTSFGDVDGSPGEDIGFRETVSFSTGERSNKSSQESTELFKLIISRKWKDAYKRIKDFPKESRFWIEDKDNHGSVVWRQLAIHKACEVHPPEKLIDALLSAYPRSIQSKNSNGDLPLHIACSECAGEKIIDYLIHHYPQGSRVQNSEGKLPLHLACRQWNDVQIIKKLLVANNQATQCVDSDGLLPLHFACGQDVDVEIVERLLYAFPDGMTKKDRWGRTPLAIASGCKSKEKDNIIKALQRDISYWTVGLMDQLKSTKVELEQMRKTEKISSEKISSLKEELEYISRRNDEVEKDNQETKEKLENKNLELQRKVQKLNFQLEDREQKIGKLIVENMSYKSTAEDLSSRVKRLSKVLPNMEGHHQQMIFLSKKLGDSLREASEQIVPFDEKTHLKTKEINSSSYVDHRDEAEMDVYDVFNR